MASVRSSLMPRASSLNGECLPRELSFGRKILFYPLDIKSHYANNKYMCPSELFKNKPGPILNFFASWDDRDESPRDQMKFRDCHILYFVEDGTMKVYEPHQRNSGLTQGCILNRQKMPKNKDEFYTLDDLNIGNNVILYGKKFKIVDCDPFTKKYLQEMGYRVGTPEPQVKDPVYEERKEQDINRPYVFKLKESVASVRYFKQHPKLLRFYVIYNNTPHFFQEKCYASLYLNIVDNTIKIVDDKKLLNYQQQFLIGNFDTCVILKPSLVPKKDLGLSIFGSPRAPRILNLTAMARRMHLQELMSCRSGGMNNAIGFLRDSNPKELEDNFEDYYTAKDLDLGKTISVFGVDVFIYDCDEFTKEYFRNVYCRELEPVSLPEPETSTNHKLVYKDDFLNNETNLQTCRDLSPAIPPWKTCSEILSQITDFQVPKANMLKFCGESREGLDGKVLNFLAKAVTKDCFFKDAYFAIQFFLQDNTMRVNSLDFNFPTSDTKHGLFFRRAKLAKPRPKDESAEKCCYTQTDLFVGNVIYVTTKPFVLIDADEYTYEYMERHCDKFHLANIKGILSKLFPLIRVKSIELSNYFKQLDFDKTGCASYSDFRTVLLSCVPEPLKNEITEHELKTIARHFAREDYVGLQIDDLVSKIQLELKKRQFNDFEKLKILFQLHELEHNDSSGHLEPEIVYKVLRSYPLHIEKDLLKSLIFKFPKCNGLICYGDMLTAINYFEKPLKFPDPNPCVLNINWERVERVKNLNKISYVSFLQELTT